MKKVCLFCQDNGKCEKVLPLERWPETAEEALSLFKELLSGDGRFNGALGLNGAYNKWFVRTCTDTTTELSWEIYPGASADPFGDCKLKGWRLELVSINERQGTVIDMTDSNQSPQYTYLVVYQFSEYVRNEWGTIVDEFVHSANCEVRLNKSIQNINDIRKIENHIDFYTEKGVSRCSVTNFILLNQPDDRLDVE